MTTHGVLIQSRVMASSVDALNRSAIAAADIDNGSVVQLSTGQSTTAGEGEVWLATQPATGAGLTHLWMAASPELVVVSSASGSQSYRGINPDPRNAYNITGDVFDVFKPQLGDVIVLTGDGITGTKSTNTYLNATNGDYKLNWAASDPGNCLAFKLLETTYISIPDGGINNQRVTAYKFECVGIE